MANVMEKTSSVETTDVMSKAVQDAMARVAEVGGLAGNTLVDSISDEAWKNWDASREIALVADKDGVDGCDDDEESHQKAA